jgi:3-isopropylmalate/(R)-2-methylmalate dehydratase small subunit
MKKFKNLSANAAPLDILNIDTDMIIPKQFLKTIKRTGLGEYLFYEMRTFTDGSVNTDFILHKPEYHNTKILVTADNFGCGSSREHAPWALVDYGIDCMIAPSFADIFYNNCFENGILPAIITPEDKETLINYLTHNTDKSVSVDLPNNTIKFGNHHITFKIDAFRKQRLLEGLDSIGLSLVHKESIAVYENQRGQTMPWL